MMGEVKTIVVTGGIGSGKSVACEVLSGRGIPVYDSDSRAKALYELHPELKAMLCPGIFACPERLAQLENALYPLLLDDFRHWALLQNSELVAFESAIILQKPFFDGFGDFVLLIEAPADVRMRRVAARGGIDEDSLRERMALQKDQRHNPAVTAVIDNDGSVRELTNKIDNFLNSISYGKNSTC